MLKSESFIKRHGYLLVALGLMLAATLMLAAMQFFAVKRIEREAQATLAANLDLQLLAMVNEARRDMFERADYITHSISHEGVRDHDLKRLARSFTRATRRYPEISQPYAVFFERGAEETGEWRVFRFIPPDPEDPNAPLYKGIALGSLVEDAEAAGGLREAFLSISDREADATFAAYAPVSLSANAPQQIFFHPVYKPNHMSRRGSLDRVGLLVITAEAANYPSPDYLKNLVARYENHQVGSTEDKLAASVEIKNETSRIIATNENIAPLRRLTFDANDRLFPDLMFGVALREKPASVFEKMNWSVLLGLSAVALSLVGLSLTWRAARREWRVAQMKSDFLASISHELKTPLTAIRAFGDLLRSGRTRQPERIREYGEMITTESDRLTALLNNILEMSRMERGVRRYKFESADLRETVASSVEMFRHTTAARDFQIDVSLPAAPLPARIDENAIRQVVLNLLSNAAKYSDAQKSNHRIEISVREGKNTVLISVRDDGIGIAHDEQKAIFNLFHRARQTEVQTVRGTGLGLAIVREIVQAHGGAISVESQPGAGATFGVSLPKTLESERESELVAAQNAVKA